MKKTMSWFVLGLVIVPLFSIILLSCAHKHVKHKIPYRIEKADRLLELSGELVEISGLTQWTEGRLAAIQDEKGKVYLLDPIDGSVLKQIKFGPKGDYEDVARVGDELWVLRSDGTLFRIKNLEEDLKVKEYETPLTTKNDVEGLYYDQAENGLWMACKESPQISDDKDLKGKRAVYFFDLEDKKLKKKPLFTVESKAIKRFQNEKYQDGLSQPFKPSAIARREKDGFIYIVSSVGQTLLVLNPEYEIFDVVRLKSRFGPQPESLSFDENHGLFIASEGQDDAATLVYFEAND